MKKIKFSKILLLLTIMTLVFSVTGCGESISVNDTKEAIKVASLHAKAASLEQWSIDSVKVLDKLSDEEITKYAQSAVDPVSEAKKIPEDKNNEDSNDNYGVNPNGMNAATVEFYNGWIKSRKDLDGLKEIKRVSTKLNEKTGQLCTVTIEASYLKRDCTFEFIFNEDFSVASVAVNPTFTTAEKVEKALLNTVIGIGTVFVVLIFIAFVISLIKYVNVIGKKSGDKSDSKSDAKANASDAAGVDVSDDTEIVAVISAAIAAYEGTSSDNLRVRSIIRRK